MHYGVYYVFELQERLPRNYKPRLTQHLDILEHS